MTASVILERRGALVSAVAVILITAATTRPAQAQSNTGSPSSDTERTVGGRLTERTLSDTTGEDATANAVLWAPRQFARFLVAAQATVARLIVDQRLVPRIPDEPGHPTTIYLFPSVFSGTSRTRTVGARLLLTHDRFAAGQNVAFGGVDDLTSESLLQYAAELDGRPVVWQAESLFASRSQLTYRGIGQTPFTDPRNRFFGESTTGGYAEFETRFLMSLGWSPIDEVQIVAATSMKRRLSRATDSAHVPSITDVLALDTFGLWPAGFWTTYSEVTMRLDTRTSTGKPEGGLLVEGYAGGGLPLGDLGAFQHGRVGGQIAGFLPILRASNTLSLRFAVDQLLAGPRIPFALLVSQPGFRGAGDRRDYLSLLGQLDYAWTFTSATNARLFVDLATVAPSIDDVPWRSLRFAAGGGVDLFGSRATVASLYASGGTDGFSLLVSLGSSRRFGDRMRRE